MAITVPNLDDRSADDLFTELRARIPVHTPEWTNLNDADPGITLLQLFSFLADNLLYRSNRVPEGNRLKFLSLLGVPVKPASPGLGIVTFSADTNDAEVPVGTVVRAGKVQFRTRQTVEVLPVEGHVFWKRPRADIDDDTRKHLERLHQLVSGAGSAGLAFYDPVLLAAPATGAPLPTIDLTDTSAGPVDSSIWVALACTPTAVARAGGDPATAVANARVALAARTLNLGIHPASPADGLTLLPQRIVPPPDASGLLFEAPARGAAPNYQRLVVSAADDVLDAPGVVAVELPPLGEFVTPWPVDPSEEGTGDYPPLVQDAKLAARIVTWVRIRYRPGASNGGAAAISWVGVNASRVVQAVAVINETVGTATGAPAQSFRLANSPVLVDGSGPAPVVEVQETDGHGQWQTWEPIDDLEAARPDDRVYQLDAPTGMIGFGDGLRGFRPPVRAGVRASYEYGGGPQGLVAIGALNVVDGLAAVKVSNPLATWGAAAGATTAEAERSVPAWLRHRDRLVTAGDFRDITLGTPGVDLGRVDVLPLFDPRPQTSGGDQTDSPGMVTVMVVPRADALAAAPPSETDIRILDGVCAWLDPRRLVTTEVHVRGPRWVHVWASVGIALLAGDVHETVERRVRETVTGYLSPLTGGLPSDGGGVSLETTGTSPVGWPLGSAIRDVDVLAAATRVAGVRYVEGVRLAARRSDGTIESDVTTVALNGLELPFPTVFVTTGPPDDPAALLSASQPQDAVPVPVIPRKC